MAIVDATKRSNQNMTHTTAAATLLSSRRSRRHCLLRPAPPLRLNRADAIKERRDGVIGGPPTIIRGFLLPWVGRLNRGQASRGGRDPRRRSSKELVYRQKSGGGLHKQFLRHLALQRPLGKKKPNLNAQSDGGEERRTWVASRVSKESGDAGTLPSNNEKTVFTRDP